jgi:predicted permease
MQTFLQDVRYAARAFGRSPGFTAIVVLTLALGVGANAVIVSLIDTLYLRPIPVPAADRIVHVAQTLPNRTGLYGLSFPDYLYYRDQAQSFSELAAHYASAPINLLTFGGSREINGSVVTANYFGLLRLQPAIGRFFMREEDEAPGRNPVVVIRRLVAREFARDPASGADAPVERHRLQHCRRDPGGVRGVFFGGLATEVWMPSAMFHVGYRYCDIVDRDCRIVDLLGRLRDDRTVADAQAEMTVLAAQLGDAYPQFDKGHGALVSRARGAERDVRSESGRIPALLSAAVVVVLAIACANIAGLLLSRNLKRRKEIGIRMAMGAAGPRLVRQLLTESVLLSLMGGAAGLLVAFWAKDLLLSLYRANSEGQRANFPVEIDAVVIAVTLAVSLLSAVVFGLAPALLALRTDLTSSLKDGVASLGRPSRLRDVLAAAQLALSIVLLMGAGLLVRSVASVYQGPVSIRVRLRSCACARVLSRRARRRRRRSSAKSSGGSGYARSHLGESRVFPQLPGWDGNQTRVWLPTDVPPGSRARSGVLQQRRTALLRHAGRADCRWTRFRRA